MPLHRSIIREVGRETEAGGRWVLVRRGAEDWCVSAEWRNDLLNGAAPNWFFPDRREGAQPIKKGDARAVWSVSIRHFRVFVKILETRGAIRRLRARWIGDGLEREWCAAEELRRRGVPVVEVLAVGTSLDRPRRRVLISREVPQAVPLDRWLAQLRGADREGRRAMTLPMIAQIAELFAVAHDRGFVHRDAHLNNILVRLPQTRVLPAVGRPRGTVGESEEFGHPAVFVDVLGGHLCHGAAPRKAVIRSLAELAHATYRSAAHTDRLRFLRAYGRERSDGRRRGPGLEIAESTRTSDGHATTRDSERRLWHDVAHEALRHGRRLARHRDRRLRRNGTYFARLSLGGGWAATVVLRLARRKIFPDAHIPDRTLEAWRPILAEATKERPNSNQAGVLESPELKFQRLNSAGLPQRLAWTLWGSVHRRAFEASHRTRHRDQPGELLLGFAERRRFGLIDRTVLIRPGLPKDPSREIQDAPNGKGSR